jgi:hypothetical protein
MVAGSSADAALFYGLAIGTLPHQHGPMARVDALRPAKIGASTRSSKRVHADWWDMQAEVGLFLTGVGTALILLALIGLIWSMVPR